MWEQCEKSGLGRSGINRGIRYETTWDATPGRKKGTHQTNINDSWDRIHKHARLDGVRLRDLRHTFASRALAIGEGLPMIGETEALDDGELHAQRVSLLVGLHGGDKGRLAGRATTAFAPMLVAA